MTTIKALDKLCEWANDRLDGYAHADAMRHASEIEAEIEERWMPLPLDAEGVPIRVGDVMVDYKTPRNVVAVAPDSFMMDGYEIDSFYRPGLAKNHRHFKPRTLEDVLTEMLDRNTDGVGLREFNRDFGAFVAHYAGEIRELLGGAE